MLSFLNSESYYDVLVNTGEALELYLLRLYMLFSHLECQSWKVGRTCPIFSESNIAMTLRAGRRVKV